MRSFSVEILGCKVNQYEGEQIAQALRRRGMVQVPDPSAADLRVVHTCSVTTQAASKSRQTVRRQLRTSSPASTSLPKPRVLVTGCWATSNPQDAAALAGAGVITHHQDLARRLDELLGEASITPRETTNQPTAEPEVNENLAVNLFPKRKFAAGVVGATNLPLLDSRQHAHQRAFLKIQDGCDARCSYCIIPSLRPKLWSKPLEEVLDEARALTAAGHVEIVLTGIFLGAYGQATALRRRQPPRPDGGGPIGELVEALCTRVPGLRRLRLSSLEPGDLDASLLRRLARMPQVVPHFHLPLQSGSTRILRRMNRQYTREDFLRLIDDVNAAFDRPAITTDIIAGFPGEDDEAFEETLAVVDYARFIHVHAFSFSPRPGTAAARWKADFVDGKVTNERIDRLREAGQRHGYAYRRQFVGETMSILVEQGGGHGRCERYFDIHLDHPAEPGAMLQVRIDRVTPTRTHGTVMQ
jgi:threonylcarbamoyladenosine tRNA methylthiotransferase MtaB